MWCIPISWESEPTKTMLWTCRSYNMNYEPLVEPIFVDISYSFEAATYLLFSEFSSTFNKILDLKYCYRDRKRGNRNNSTYRGSHHDNTRTGSLWMCSAISNRYHPESHDYVYTSSDRATEKGKREKAGMYEINVNLFCRGSSQRIFIALGWKYWFRFRNY